jgi:hypothetical protein
VDGSRCGSPSIAGESHCYWHRTLYRQPKKLELPALEDPNALQVALNRVVQAMASGVTDIRTGCGLLYGLSLAQVNMRHLTAGRADEYDRRSAREELDPEMLQLENEMAELLAQLATDDPPVLPNSTTSAADPAPPKHGPTSAA